MMTLDDIHDMKFSANQAAQKFAGAYWREADRPESGEWLYWSAMHDIINALRAAGYTVTKIEPVAEAAE